MILLAESWDDVVVTSAVNVLPVTSSLIVHPGRNAVDMTESSSGIATPFLYSINVNVHDLAAKLLRTGSLIDGTLAILKP